MPKLNGSNSVNRASVPRFLNIATLVDDCVMSSICRDATYYVPTVIIYVRLELNRRGLESLPVRRGDLR